MVAVAAALGGRGDARRGRRSGVVVHSAAQIDLDPLLACARAGLACGFYARPRARRRAPGRPRGGADRRPRRRPCRLCRCAARRAGLALPGAGAGGRRSKSTLRALAWGRPASPPSPSSPSSPPTRACRSPPAFRRLVRRPTSGSRPPTARSSRWPRSSAAPRCWPSPATPTARSAYSPAQLVLDAETWSNVAAVAAGITVDDETPRPRDDRGGRHRRQRPRPEAHAAPHERRLAAAPVRPRDLRRLAARGAPRRARRATALADGLSPATRCRRSTPRSARRFGVSCRRQDCDPRMASDVSGVPRPSVGAGGRQRPRRARGRPEPRGQSADRQGAPREGDRHDRTDRIQTLERHPPLQGRVRGRSGATTTGSSPTGSPPWPTSSRCST